MVPVRLASTLGLDPVCGGAFTITGRSGGAATNLQLGADVNFHTVVNDSPGSTLPVMLPAPAHACRDMNSGYASMVAFAVAVACSMAFGQILTQNQMERLVTTHAAS